MAVRPAPRRPGWHLFRAALGLGIALLVFVVGLDPVLSPGQALAAAIAVRPRPVDPRWGVMLGLALWAGLAFVSVAVRAWQGLERRR